MSPASIFLLRWLLPALLSMSLLSRLSASPTHEVVQAFSLPPQEPGFGGLLRVNDGSLWGTTLAGGTYGLGTIFRASADLTRIETIVAFSDGAGSTIGREPRAGLIEDSSGFLWGTTMGGGSRDANGTVYKVHKSTGQVTTIVEFTGRSGPLRGSTPVAALAKSNDGSLWGTTSRGGSGDQGTIFKLDPTSGTVATVADFDESTRGTFGPYGPLVMAADGLFWGTTYGNSGSDLGTVFNVDPGTGVKTTVARFSSLVAGGIGPSGVLCDDGAGFLWGTTQQGKTSSFGTVFKVNQTTGELTTMAKFSGQNGANRGATPLGGLVRDKAGILWGTTSAGGTQEQGTIFRISPESGELTTVLDLGGNADFPIATKPRGELRADQEGVLLGLGGNGEGGVFRFDISSSAISHGLGFTYDSSETRGRHPEAGLSSDDTGRLWGTTAFGGRYWTGTVFRLDPMTGKLDTMVDFSSIGPPYPGSRPVARLTSAGGFMWGTTRYGGATYQGTIFKINSNTGEFSVVADFMGNTGPLRGSDPHAELLSDASGNLWGSSRFANNQSGRGSIFKIDRQTGKAASIVDFSENSLGSEPVAALVDDGTGHFWGTTNAGGASGLGTFFSFDPVTHALSSAFDFTNSAGSHPGRRPRGALLRDQTGRLWGTTSAGGSADHGTIFKYAPDTGTFTTVIELGGTGSLNPGSQPYAGLVEASDGTYWGTTYTGGSTGKGTVYQLTPATGQLVTPIQFTGTGPQAQSGANPMYSALHRHSDGNLYGTTRDGGPAAGGTIFRIRFGPTPLTLDATHIDTTSALLRGSINPNGYGNTSVSFQYWPEGAPSEITTLNWGMLPDGSSPVEVSLAAAGLTSGTIYRCRVVGTNENSPRPQLGYELRFSTLLTLGQWRQRHFGTPLNQGEAADQADPDGDGVPNLAEYAFGRPPQAATNGDLPAWQRAGGSCVATFTTPPGVHGVIYAAEWSTSGLSGEWSPVSDSGVAPHHVLQVPIQDSKPIFLRYRVISQ